MSTKFTKDELDLDRVYCPHKFRYLKVDIEKRLVYNCHKALPHRITSEWLKGNTGKIFNTDIMVNERETMLRGQRNYSCGSCYDLEDDGKLTTRMLMLERNKEIYKNPYAECKVLDMVLNTDCNLSCVYCDGDWSSSWRREVKQFGQYRNRPKNWSDVYDRASQNKKNSTAFFQLFLKEIEHMKKLEKVIITGGETFLFNRLEDILDRLDHVPEISVVTGLGVSPFRFNKVIEMLAGKKNVTLAISAEGLGPHYEFVRHGAKYDSLLKYISLIQEKQIKFHFSCTVSNLTVIGLYEFYEKFHQQTWLTYNPVVHPWFLQKHIIDDKTKEILTKTWSRHNDHFSRYVLHGLQHTVSEPERQGLTTYLKQLQTRRKVRLDFLPSSFLQWAELQP